MTFRSTARFARATVLSAVIAFACGCGGGGTMPFVPGPVPSSANLFRLTLVSTDPFANPTSQHATEVEPSMASFQTTVVATFQVGRFFVAGSSDIGFATSHDGGATWLSGFLPGTTHFSQPAGSFDSVSDPVVAFDADHGTWLIASLPILFNGAAAPAVLISRSTDGLNWSLPVAVAPAVESSDKEWIACDNTSSSPFYGHCYVQWDDPVANGIIHVATSTNGGISWGAATSTAGNGTGIAGQPMVQPNGTVIVPIDDFNEFNTLSFVSHDGGATWSAPVLVAPISVHFIAGNLRSGPLPSAAMDAGGKAYLVWQDCRFRAGCASNDLVLSTSTNGVAWSAPAQIPIDPVTSGRDHFIPGLSIAPGTSGATAHLGLTYYSYPNANCAGATCQLNAGYVSSHDGGVSWSVPVGVAGPMRPSWLPLTNQGVMVGDYIASTFVGSQPYGIYSIANSPLAGIFNEAMYVSKAGVLPPAASVRRTVSTARPVPGVHSDFYHRLRPPKEID
jgi:hypothetical protein